jgi:hypothetical protein
MGRVLQVATSDQPATKDKEKKCYQPSTQKLAHFGEPDALHVLFAGLQSSGSRKQLLSAPPGWVSGENERLDRLRRVRGGVVRHGLASRHSLPHGMHARQLLKVDERGGGGRACNEGRQGAIIQRVRAGRAQVRQIGQRNAQVRHACLRGAAAAGQVAVSSVVPIAAAGGKKAGRGEG